MIEAGCAAEHVLEIAEHTTRLDQCAEPIPGGIAVFRMRDRDQNRVERTVGPMIKQFDVMFAPRLGRVGAGIVERGWSAPVDLRAFVMVGLCGGFTTFSAFSLQTLELLQAGRHGAALAYMAGSLAACVAVVWAGWVVGRG